MCNCVHILWRNGFYVNKMCNLHFARDGNDGNFYLVLKEFLTISIPIYKEYKDDNWCVIENKCVKSHVCRLTMQAACTASDTLPALGSHQKTWQSKRCPPTSMMKAKVCTSRPTPIKDRKRTRHSTSTSSSSWSHMWRWESQARRVQTPTTTHSLAPERLM